MPTFPILAKKLQLTAQELSFDPQDIENCSIETLEKTFAILKQQYLKLVKATHRCKKDEADDFYALKNVYEQAVKYVQNLIQARQTLKGTFDPSIFETISAVQLKYIFERVEINLGAFIRIVEKCQQQLEQDYEKAVSKANDAAYANYHERMQHTITTQRYSRYCSDFNRIQKNYRAAYFKAADIALIAYEEILTQKSLLNFLLFPLRPILRRIKLTKIRETLKNQVSAFDHLEPLSYEHWLQQCKTATQPMAEKEICSKGEFLSNEIQDPKSDLTHQLANFSIKLKYRKMNNNKLLDHVLTTPFPKHIALQTLYYGLFKPSLVEDKTSTKVGPERKYRP